MYDNECLRNGSRCLPSTFAWREPSERLSTERRGAARCGVVRRGAGVGGERTHLDKCTIWHCSRENRRPCASPRRASAPPPAPPAPRANRGPSRHSLPAFWREALAASASATCRVRVIARFQRDLSTRHLLRIEIENSRLALSLSRPKCYFSSVHF